MGQWYRVCRLGCRAYMTVLQFGRVYDRWHVPATGPVLLVSNHQSFFDPVVVGYGLGREVDYMARETLFINPLFRTLIRWVNAFPVKRNEVDIQAVKETFRRLKAGHAVLLFPEGTRTSDGRIAEFKPGLAVLARKAKVPVLPVVIDGAYEAWPRTSPVPRPLIPICVKYGQPFSVDQIGEYRPEEFTRLIHRRMIHMQGELRRQVGRMPYHYDRFDNEDHTC